MLRYIKLVLLAAILIVIVTLSLANRGAVTLHLLPEAIAHIMPLSVQVPLFLVILISILVGLLLGYIFEWLREHKHRREAARRKREAAQLKGQVQELKRKHMTDEDEVLAIIDGKNA